MGTDIITTEVEGTLMLDDDGNFYTICSDIAKVILLRPLLAEHLGCNIRLVLERSTPATS